MVSVSILVRRGVDMNNPLGQHFRMDVELHGEEEVNIEEVRDGVRTVLHDWAQSWLRLGNMKIVISTQDDLTG